MNTDMSREQPVQGLIASQSSSPEEPIGPYQLFALALSLFALASLVATTALALDRDILAVLQYADTAVCLMFFGDFCYSTWSASNRLVYLRKWGWIDLLSSIPTIDALRWGRAIRVMRVLRVLRAAKSARILASFIVQRRTQSTVLTVLLLAFVLLVFASVAVLQFEVPAGGNIGNAREAVWWAISTMATVGYGDRYPVTPEGRTIAVMLMIAGVGVFGTLSGLVASWFLSPQGRATEHELEDLHRMVSEIHARTTKSP